MASHSLSCAPLCGVSFLILELFTIFWSSAENPFLSSSTHAQNYPSFPTSLSAQSNSSQGQPALGPVRCACVYLCVCVCGGFSSLFASAMTTQADTLFLFFVLFCYFFSLPTFVNKLILNPKENRLLYILKGHLTNNCIKETKSETFKLLDQWHTLKSMTTLLVVLSYWEGVWLRRN